MTTKVMRSVDDAQADFAVVTAAEVGADASGAASTAQSAAIAAAASDATTKANAAQAAAIAASQPVDSDLTAIAALTTTSYGRALLELANAAAGRTALGLGTAAVAASGDFQPNDSDLTAIAALTTTSYGRSLLEAANAAALRTLAGLVIGTDVQAFDADIPTVAASQGEMEAGTEAALRSMSPLRVAQAIAELADGGGSDDQTAAEVPFTPAGTIAASNTQAAVEEVATDAATALSTHDADTTSVHGIANTAKLWNVTTITGDVANADATPDTLADVTGLSFAVVSGTRYWFRFVIPYDAAAVSTGSRWTINGPTTSFLRYRSNYSTNSSSDIVNTGLAAYNLPAASSAGTATAGAVAIVEGIITPSANGTVIARFASEITVSAVTARAGASVFWMAL